MTHFTLVSRTAAAWGADAAGLEAIVVTDGSRMLVLGEAPAARGYAARVPRYFQAGEPLAALERYCRRAVSSYMQASAPSESTLRWMRLSPNCPVGTASPSSSRPPARRTAQRSADAAGCYRSRSKDPGPERRPGRCLRGRRSRRGRFGEDTGRAARGGGASGVTRVPSESLGACGSGESRWGDD